MSEQAVLDAPTDTKTGADEKPQGSLIDTPQPDKPKDGTEGNQPPADPKAKPDAPPKDGAEKPQTPEKPQAPESYADPKLPDGFEIDAAVRTKFDTLAKSMNVSQEQYQQLVDLQVELAESTAKKVDEAFKKQVSDWREQTVKALGADFKKEIAFSSKAIDRFFTDPKQNKEFREMLATSGLGDWAPMVRLLIHYGKSISEDSLAGSGKSTGQELSIEKRLHPDLP